MFKYWLLALRRIPRLSPQEWRRLDPVARWLVMTRSAVLVMTVLSGAIAGVLAAKLGVFRFWPWFLATLGITLAHAANNLLNDLVDWARGLDQGNYFRAQYGPHALADGLVSKREFLVYLGITGLAALAVGVYFLLRAWPGVLWFFLPGAFVLLFYTWPLKNLGLGELAVLLVWGPLMVGGVFYVTAGWVNWQVLVASLPYALGVTSVLLGKHIDKLPQDKAKGVRTLPVLLGEKAARALTIALVVLQYLAVLFLVAVRFFSPWLLVVLFALPVFRYLWRAYTSPRPTERPPEVPEDVWPLFYVAVAFWHNRRFGSLYLLGLLLDLLWGLLR